MKIFLIGFGNMGRAIAKTLNSAKSGYEISVASKEGLTDMTASEHSVAIDNSYSGLKDADAVILAVKQYQIHTFFPPASLLVSLL